MSRICTNFVSEDFKSHFCNLFREEKTQKNQCWKSLFIDTYSDVGRYIDHYAAIKKAWDDLKKYLEPRCPRMVLSLKGKVNYLRC